MASSVIIPCYNGARFLRAALDSVLAQTRPAAEVIVVDDGSTDESGTVAAEFAPAVTLIHQLNQGESVARNVGLRAAHAEYVLFLDADDLLAPDALQQLEAAVMDMPGAVAVMGTAYFTEDPAAPFDQHSPTMSGFLPLILQTNFGPPHSWYTPRDLALAVGGFREELVNSEDWEFWGRVGLTGAPLVTVGYIGALYRRHARSQVATTPEPAILKGRLTVGEMMATQVLAHPDLLDRVGEPMFWTLWAMIRQARRAGVPEADMRPAEALARELVRRSPGRLRGSPFGRAVRALGMQRAERLRASLSRSALGGGPD